MRAATSITDLQVCEAYNRSKLARDAGGPFLWPEEILQKETGQALKVCIRAMERACGRGLIEYGVSLRAGWLTDKGRALLGTKIV